MSYSCSSFLSLHLFLWLLRSFDREPIQRVPPCDHLCASPQGPISVISSVTLSCSASSLPSFLLTLSVFRIKLTLPPPPLPRHTSGFLIDSSRVMVPLHYIIEASGWLRAPEASSGTLISSQAGVCLPRRTSPPQGIKPSTWKATCAQRQVCVKRAVGQTTRLLFPHFLPLIYLLVFSLFICLIFNVIFILSVGRRDSTATPYFSCTCI